MQAYKEQSSQASADGAIQKIMGANAQESIKAAVPVKTAQDFLKTFGNADNAFMPKPNPFMK
jgi:hypothetical protein